MKEIIFEDHEKKTMDMPFIFHKDHINDEVTASYGNINDLYWIKNCPINWHENIEIEYFVSGKASFICAGNEYEATPGDIFIASSNKLHYIASEESAVYYCLIIDSRFCSYNGISISGIDFNLKAHSPMTAELYENIIKEYETDSEYYETAVRSAVLTLLLHLCRNEKMEQSEGTVSNVSGVIKKAVYYINEHFAEKIKIDTICETINISKYYFIREFKKETRYSPINYINYVRCERAKEMIIEGMSPGHVCTACGFDDQSYFAKVFKKYTGVLPSEFSKKTQSGKKK